MLRRPLALLLALLVLVALGVWLTRPGVEPIGLGYAAQLVAHPASEVFALGDADGRWRVLRGDAPDGEPVSGEQHLWRGLPAVAADGRVLGLAAAGEGLVLQRLDEPGAEPLEIELPNGRSGAEWRLLGLVGPLAWPVLEHGASGEVWWREPSGWRRLEDAEGPARLPSAAPVTLTDARAALAFRGAQGWEAWDLASRPPRRRVARDCLGEPAAFTPDGAALVVDGPMMNIYRLELDDGRLGHMADGNLGHSPRVPWTAGVRGDPPMLVVAQFDLQGWLQIVQTNFSGGGRWQFNTGFEHHYLPAVSPAGRWLAYAQSPFDLDGEQPFEEDLYLFDFDHGTTPALALGRRVGGTPQRGPAWVARPDGAALVWVADGRVWRLDVPD